MAISFGASNGAVSLTGTGPFTISGVTVSGTNTYGVVAFWTTSAPSSVTWNGSTMTQVSTFGTVPENGVATAYVYGLAGVSTGDIVINNGVSVGTAHYAYYTGVSGTDAATPVTNTNASTTSLATSITPVSDNCWAICFGMARDVPGNGISAGAGTVKRGSDADDSNIFDNNAAIHPAGSTTLTVTQTSASAMSAILFAIAPVGATTTRLFTLMGVGT